MHTLTLSVSQPQHPLLPQALLPKCVCWSNCNVFRSLLPSYPPFPPPAKALLPKCVCWSNGNVFRSLTLLAVTYCEQQGIDFSPDVITAEVCIAARGTRTSAHTRTRTYARNHRKWGAHSQRMVARIHSKRAAYSHPHSQRTGCAFTVKLARIHCGRGAHALHKHAGRTPAHAQDSHTHAMASPPLHPTAPPHHCIHSTLFSFTAAQLVPLTLPLSSSCLSSTAL